jgi:hypothetical protein
MTALAITVAKDPLTEAIDGLVAESIDGFSTAALGDDIISIRRAIDRLEAESLRRIERFRRDGGAHGDGAPTLVSWMRARCGLTVKAAAYCVHLGRALGELPAALDSARAGRACFSNVAMIGRLANDVGVQRLAPYESTLVGAAETLDPAGMRMVTESARLGIDPDGVLADANRAHFRRWAACDQTYGGNYVLRGQLDAEKGAIVKAAFDAGSGALVRSDTRSGSERNADALVEMAAAFLRAGDHGDVHGQRPHLTVTVSAERLRSDVVGGRTGASDDGTLRAAADVPPAVLEGVGPIHPETARRIACDAVRTVVTVAPVAHVSPAWAVTTKPVPLSVGRATRTIPAHIRNALRVRDGGCRFPECDRSPSWTDGHRIVHWADGGPTDLDNLVSLCRRHHRQVHEEGWSITITDGVVSVRLFPP